MPEPELPPLIVKITADVSQFKLAMDSVADAVRQLSRAYVAMLERGLAGEFIYTGRPPYGGVWGRGQMIADGM